MQSGYIRHACEKPNDRRLWGVSDFVQNPNGDDGEGDDDANLPVDVRATIAGRYRKFARHMASCENATKAARLAGWSEKSAGKQGYRLMQRPEVVAMVEEERAERAKRLEVTDERIIAAYAAIAFGDARRVVKWDDLGEGKITDSDDLTDDEAMIVAGVDRVERTDAKGNTTVTIKVRREPRGPALDALAKIKGLMRERVEVEGLGAVADEMAQLRAQRRARLAASNAAKPIDVEVIEGEEINPKATPASNPGHSDAREEITPEPGIAQRFAARMPREDDNAG